jgi:hypothetical protein
MTKLMLRAVAGSFGVARLAADAPLPPWADAGATDATAGATLVSITRTADELSIVCTDAAIPDGVRAERGFVAWRVAGTIDFAVTGVLAALTAPLAAAGVSVFALSTFDTDYVLVRAADRARAAVALATVATLDER